MKRMLSRENEKTCELKCMTVRKKADGHEESFDFGYFN